MKYLSPPTYDDLQIFRALSTHPRAKIHPLLGQNLGPIGAAYQHYKNSGGNPHLLHSPLLLDDDLKENMQKIYEKKIEVLKYIDEIRNKLSPDVCPMCGSYGNGQVDHIIPKTIYPEFSFFSHNLIPACSCNQTKSTNFKGPNGERLLHPYYDIELRDRICYLAFSGSVDTPDLDVERVLPYASNQHVKFHIESVVKKSNIFNWASKEWSKLQTRPNRTRLQRQNESVSRSDIKSMLEREFISYDEEYGTPNNWKSMFYYGLALKEDFHEHIRNYVNAAQP
ncbi:HNH endonuclease [Undibacterium sp. TC4M20W]|uniref:HNH endonuclease n=1 Tax=Undibacterium sp. TC4M20W TaxID=3413052 RepID=UPI003BF1F2D5